ncbi:pollen allergen Che a 1-like [Andrographis paniculata]|uniref:pollen allergen Che a 1-like n=1 Tax=Andrographis paniculata TaxID=175694 RepID=UPI0021E80765|nr:pollen allergen Che a 1-like [Andrographis paniculata]
MAKYFILLVAVCFLPAIVSARFAPQAYRVTGVVYCDTCRCGYENEATEYMADATVKIECKNKDTGKVTFSKEGRTNSEGRFTIMVNEDRGDDYCDAALVKSSNPECRNPNPGRDKARVILTSNNGMTSNTRYVNAMGFERNVALESCPQILQKYEVTEDEMN